MRPINDALVVINEFLANPGPYRPALALIKGFRNGVVYGAKIRAPHSLVMTFLFKEGSLKDKFTFITKATINHSRNLAYFTVVYKLCKILLVRNGKQHPLHVFIAGCITGFIVFNKKTPVSNQILLYLLSRAMLGLANLAVKRGTVSLPKGFVPFPWFASFIWGLTMLLFEYERDTLPDSQVASLVYLHEDINAWHSLKDFIWHNK
ncbi:Peroxisomal membrane protein 4 [Chamberlinius hualienensis]